MPEVRLESVTKRFGETVALDNISLKIAEGELFFLLGPSGCGKTTCLRVVAGLYTPDAGRLYFGEREVTNLPPFLRNTGMVFQNYALFPHLTVEKNVEYGLRVRRVSAQERKRKVQRALEMVRMAGTEKKLPHQLSGGQQQRVALARALVIEPDVLLLDEPLSNLDAKLRIEMREEIRRIHRESGVTAIYVTHDQKEALSTADRLAVMRNGKIEQVGTPFEVYRHPQNPFVASFIGETNFLPCEVIRNRGDETQLFSEWGALVAATAQKHFREGEKVIVSVRPEALTLREERVPPPASVTSEAPNRLRGKIMSVIYLGDHVQYTLQLHPPYQLKCTLTNPAHVSALPVGTEVTVEFRPEDVSVFAVGTNDDDFSLEKLPSYMLR